MSNNITDFLVRRALQLFEQQPHRRWTVQSLADELGVSRASLARRFHAAMKEPPMTVLTKIRIKHAQSLLVSSNSGLAFIADAVGYNSEFAFSRTFKRYTGLAPGQFRKNHTLRPSMARMVA